MTGLTPAPRLTGHALARPPARPGPPAADAARVIATLHQYPCWSAFWDARYGVWRVAEDDPDSALYAESSDADTVIGYITSHA
jgi:hypothetical protein